MIFFSRNRSEVVLVAFLVFMVEIHVRSFDIIWFCRIPWFFQHFHAIDWCNCRCPLEKFDSAKWRFFRGLSFPLLKKCNRYRQLLHRAPPSETNLRNDQIRIQLIFRYFVPLDEVIADIGESRWVHKMKELSMFSIADTQFHYGTALNRFTVYGWYAFDRIVNLIVIMSWWVPLSWARTHTLNNMNVQYSTT